MPEGGEIRSLRVDVVLEESDDGGIVEIVLIEAKEKGLYPVELDRAVA